MFEIESALAIHNGGYHGTDIRSAERIIEEGFRAENGDIFFAPLNNLWFAQTHGIRRARNAGDRHYGVVQAMFPGKKLEFGMGGDQIRIPTEELGRITIVGLRVYSLEDLNPIITRNRDELQNPNL